MRSPPALWLAVATALAPTACRDATELSFRVTTDVPCSRVAGTSIAVGTLDGLEAKPPASSSATCQDGKLGTLVVVPSGANDEEVAVRIVTGLDGKNPDACAADGFTGGCIVARRALRFAPHATTIVPVAMESACRDVVCGGDETCARGACVSARAECNGGSCAIPAPPPPSRWKPMRAGAAGGVRARAEFSALWTGKELLVFGGTLEDQIADDGGRYDPRKDAWSIIPKGPLAPRYRHAAVWSGKEMIVFGGYGTGDGGAYDDGASFDPATNAWTSLPAPPAQLEGPTRERMAAVWAPTTGEMIVWGGATEPNPAKEFKDGAAYSPARRSWRMIAPSPLGARLDAAALWVDGRMFVYGGSGDPADGAFYDPKEDRWSPVFASTLRARSDAVVAWSGGAKDPIAIWSGADTGDRSYDDGVLFDPATAQFTPMTKLTSADGAVRVGAAGWMTNAKLYAFGGALDSRSGKLAQGGVVYDLAANAWSAMPSDGAPAPRWHHAAVWTGTEAVVWGGTGTDGKPRDDGALFAH